jgi:NAD(P)-dependent dehydrogenase (short-subunit alcohol dehydrogenase family)
VVVVDIDGDAAQEVAEALPGEALGVQADVSREEDVDRYLQAAVDRFGRIDLHHLNAGIVGSVVPITDVTVEDFDRVMAVNLRGPFLGLRGAFRQYFAQGGGGAVVVTASIASLRGSSDLFPYHASKHGVLGLVRNSAVYGGPLGVRVNAIAPGIVPTDLFANDPDAPGGGNDMAQRAMTTPLRRPGRPEEIASVVAFMLSDDSTYMTGEVISVDGGATVVNTVRPSGGAGAWDTATLDARTARWP